METSLMDSVAVSVTVLKYRREPEICENTRDIPRHPSVWQSVDLPASDLSNSPGRRKLVEYLKLSVGVFILDT